MIWQDRAFVSTWNTENAGSATKTIVIPTSSTGTYACTVDWGDGTTNYMTTYNDAAWTHVYANAGTYTVKIYGKFVGIVFNNSGDRLKILNISKWGPDFRLGTTQGFYFYGCSNLIITATDILNMSGTTIMNSALRSCSSITTIPNFTSWDTSLVTSAQNMMQSCTSFNMPLTGMNWKSCTSFLTAFQSCTSFNGDVSNWILNTTSTISFTSLWQSCTSFNKPLTGWNTSKVTSFSSTFNSCTAYNSDVSMLDTSSATTMTSMFSGCTVFNQSVSNFNTSAVTNMSNMFSGCAAFNQSVSNFNTAAVTTMASMFNGCTVFNQSVSSFNVSNVTAMNSMFFGCAAFNSTIFTGTNINQNFTNMFNGCTVFNQPVTNLVTSSATNMNSMFINCSAFNQSVSSFATTNVTNTASTLSGCTAFNQDVSSWIIASLTSATNMFLNSGFTITNYNKLLDSATGWPSQSTIQTGVTFSAGTAHYSGANAIAGRAVLTGTKSWTITDGGTP